MDSTKRKKSKVKSNLSLKQKARIRNRARATPWSNPSEFDYVGRCLSNATCLFEDHNDIMPLNELSFNELIYGIKQCELWRIRAENGRLPHSVEITCSLAELLLRDAEQHQVILEQNNTGNKRNSYDVTSSLSLRLSYASAIIRGVNGIADSMQKNRALNGSSVAHLCSTIGIPLWVVDLRHDAAHNDLPSLVALRLAAKVLLRFLIDRYWIVLEEMRSKWRNDGIALLMEYKKSSKALDKLQSLILKGAIGNDDGEEVGNENEDDADEDEMPYYGAYSILLMAEKKGEKKKNELKPKAKDVKAKAEQEMKGRTPRQCLNAFIKCMPMDLGMELLLSYLVTGGIGDAPTGRGVMIPGSAITFPETIEGARKIRERYSVILIYMSSKWPGFVHAVLVHMVDFMLHLNQNASQEVEDPGKKRKLFFLTHWIRYILSREFFCLLGWYDASFKGSKNIRQRPREKWSLDLIEYMESPAPIDVLRDAKLPLYGLYKRCIEEGNQELALIFNMVICDGSEQSDNKMASKKRAMDELRTGPRESNDIDDAVMSLDDIEALMAETDSKQIPLANESGDQIESASKISAWAICEAWEPCAIGSIPGHP
jgi:ribosomal biogenesis protein LAS1